MPSLTRLFTWQRWEPALGENLELESAKRFWLQLAVGLTLPERDGLAASLDAKPEGKPEWQHWADVLSPWVRFGSEPLRVNDRDVKTLAELMEVAAGQLGAGGHLAQDLLGQLLYWNSYRGAREVFSERLSGGSTGTRGQ